MILLDRKRHHNSFNGGVKRTVVEIIGDARRAAQAFLAYAEKNGIKQANCGKKEFSWRGRWKAFNDKKFHNVFPSFNFFEQVKISARALEDRGLLEPFLAELRRTALFGHPQLSSNVAMQNINLVVSRFSSHEASKGEKAQNDGIFNRTMMEAALCCVPRRIGNFAKSTKKTESAPSEEAEPNLSDVYWPMQGNANAVGKQLEILFLNMRNSKVLKRKKSVCTPGKGENPAEAAVAGDDIKTADADEHIAFVDHLADCFVGVLQLVPEAQRDLEVVDEQIFRAVKFALTEEAELSARGKAKRKVTSISGSEAVDQEAFASKKPRLNTSDEGASSAQDVENLGCVNDNEKRDKVPGWSAVEKDVVAKIFAAHKQLAQRTTRLKQSKLPIVSNAMAATPENKDEISVVLRKMETDGANSTRALAESDRLALSQFLSMNKARMPVHLQPMYAFFSETVTDMYEKRGDGFLELKDVLKTQPWKLVVIIDNLLGQHSCYIICR